MKALADAGYLADAVDLPGYGQSSPSQATPRTWLRELLDLLNVVGLGLEQELVLSDNAITILPPSDPARTVTTSSRSNIT